MRGSKLEDGYLKREFNDRSTCLLLIATYLGTWSCIYPLPQDGISLAPRFSAVGVDLNLWLCLE
jgi:hypothetical protein